MASMVSEIVSALKTMPRFAVSITETVWGSAPNVTVFLSGAQISREANIDIISGKTILKFDNLSQYIDKKSIQVKGKGQYTILSVNHQNNYLNQKDKSQELKDLENKINFTVNLKHY